MATNGGGENSKPSVDCKPGAVSGAKHRLVASSARSRQNIAASSILAGSTSHHNIKPVVPKSKTSMPNLKPAAASAASFRQSAGHTSSKQPVQRSTVGESGQLSTRTSSQTVIKASGGGAKSSSLGHCRPRSAPNESMEHPTLSVSCKPVALSTKAARPGVASVIAKSKSAPVAATPCQGAQSQADEQANHERKRKGWGETAAVNPATKASSVASHHESDKSKEGGQPIQTSNTASDGGGGGDDENHGHTAKWKIDDFRIGKGLGRGRFGQVYLAMEKTSKYLVAIKVLFKSDLESAKILEQVKREIQIQSHLKHKNILRLYTYFRDEKRIYLVLEYATNGNLYKHLQKVGRLSEAETAKYVFQLAGAIQYLHTKNVIHRDLKPENILLNSEMDIKLADFGWSVHAPSSARETLCGTHDYLSPEMIENIPHSAAVDIWSVGVLCYEMLAGKPTFEMPSLEQTYQRIRQVAIIWPTHFSDGAKHIISGMLKKDPSERSSLDQIRSHSWVIQNYPNAMEELSASGSQCKPSSQVKQASSSTL